MRSVGSSELDGIRKGSIKNERKTKTINKIGKKEDISRMVLLKKSRGQNSCPILLIIFYCLF